MKQPARAALMRSDCRSSRFRKEGQLSAPAIRLRRAMVEKLQFPRARHSRDRIAERAIRGGGQAIFSKSRSNSRRIKAMSNGRFIKAVSNGRFIKAVSNGRFIKALAILSKQKQPNGQTSRFEPRIASSILPAQVYRQNGPNDCFVQARSNGRFINALAVLSRQKQPSCHI